MGLSSPNPEFLMSEPRIFLRDRGGQALVEYGMILLLVAVICIVALSAIFGKTSNPMSNVANALP